MIEACIYNVRVCSLGQVNSTSQLGVLVGNDEYELVTFRCLAKRSHDIQCGKFECSKCLRETQFTRVETVWFISCAAWVCADNRIDVGGHERAVKVAKLCVMHVSMT